LTGLSEKVELLHECLERATIPHAFGGALALAFCVANARATADIDVNVFVSPARVADVFGALPDGVKWTDEHRTEVAERGQVRLPWGDTPLDLFFAYHDFHEQARRRTRVVTFRQIDLPVLDCGDLIVFKALFGRPQDWVDIENVIDSGGAELEEPLERLETLVGTDDPKYARLATMGQRSVDESEPYRRVFGTPHQEEE
jgi:hypothetical protein